MTELNFVPIMVGLLAMLVLRTAVRVVPAYQRVVILRRGRVAAVRGPGLTFVIPVLDTPRTLDLRLDVIEVPAQSGCTRDGVDLEVAVTLQCNVTDPGRAAVGALACPAVVALIARSTLANTIPEFDSHFWLTERDRLADYLEHAIQIQTAQHGMYVTAVTPLLVKLRSSSIYA